VPIQRIITSAKTLQFGNQTSFSYIHYSKNTRIVLNPIHLHSFFFRNEASMVQVLLQSYGIEYELRDAHMGDVLLHISAAGGGQKMFVAESDYQKAKQLLIDNGYLAPAEDASRSNLY
jgi:hypothetical protein